MKPVVVSVLIPASLETVWAEVERLENHPQWMTDAVGIEFDDDRRRGVGTKIRVATKIGPFRTTDAMEFTEWERPRAMGVAHKGLFTGTGRFTLEAEGDGTRFTWTESVLFPWFLGGPLGAFVARPILTRIWEGNLRRLRLLFTGP